MAADDPVDTEAMIFTEADVYMIAGYLAGAWDVPYSDEERVATTERAIAAALSNQE